jgi:2-keto-3-deoxy-L-rhamnonate aldolase RhmA
LRTAWLVTIAAGSLIGGAALQQKVRLNPVIDLLTAKRPVFGLYAPANPRGGRGGGRGAAQAGAAATTTPAPAAPQKSAAELAKDAVAYTGGDYIFDGSMETQAGDTSARFDSAYVRFTAFSKGMTDAGSVVTASSKRISHPLFVKTPPVAANMKLAADRIGRQLNIGAMGIVLTDVETAEEVETAVAAMRFKSKGGTRPEDIGNAAALWGVSDKEYREKADVWPLNPNGELVNFTIIESEKGLTNLRQIAAVKGIGVLFPGAGTLRGVFSKPDSSGRRVTDEVAWEKSIQDVLAACKEFKVACGYPANDSTMMQRRIKEGFTVFITAWGENGFKAVEVGKRVGGR